jgi:hypothetical protein
MAEMRMPAEPNAVIGKQESRQNNLEKKIVLPESLCLRPLVSLEVFF